MDDEIIQGVPLSTLIKLILDSMSFIFTLERENTLLCFHISQEIILAHKRRSGNESMIG